jgi:hypothetical protein
MPIHDWTRVEAGTFHHFHQSWTIAITNALNTGGLPEGFFAMADQILSGPIPDVVTLKRRPKGRAPSSRGGVAVAAPKARIITKAVREDIYSKKANRVVIRHELGEVVAIIEIVSPGNKNSRHALRAFVEKACQILDNGISMLIVDLFPPSSRDPQGIHKAIWDEVREDDPFELPPDKPLTVAAYSAGLGLTAYIEPVAVGDPLPGLPIFLDADYHVPAPLEATYQATWDVCPEPIRELLEPPAE